MPTNYQNSVVYKIVCNDASIHDMYIGSTSNFTKRKYAHKNNCNNPNGVNHNLKVYTCIRGLGGWSNWSMIPILQYPCESKMALNIKEREIMESHNATLNNNRAFTTDEEKLQQRLETNKLWLENNPLYQKNYRIKKKLNNYKCECGCYLASKGILNRHRKTTKHFTLMESVVNQI